MAIFNIVVEDWNGLKEDEYSLLFPIYTMLYGHVNGIDIMHQSFRCLMIELLA